MKRLALYLCAFLLPVACGRELPLQEPSSRAPRGEVFHGLIELGEKLEDPYTVENMQKALNKVYPTKADRVDIHPTDLYVRFLPSSDADLQRLKAGGLYLQDHPMDYRIVREGDYYMDPSLEEDAITWQYAVVGSDYAFPEGIEYEILDHCYISEHDPYTRAAMGDVDWRLVEEESFRLTGNGDMLAPVVKSGAQRPSGRITLSDPGFCEGKPVGLAGVMVACNVFVKVGLTHTDRDGYYTIPMEFTSDPRYRLVFQNDKGFSVGFNLVMLPASVSTLGSGGPDGIDYNITEQDDAFLMRRAAVNNAAYDYLSRCTLQDLGISAPPTDIRIWLIPFLSQSSAPMLHHGAGLDHELLKQYVGNYVTAVKMFLPDITIGTDNADTIAKIYNATVHEMAHASHFSQVGTEYWTPFITYIITSYFLEGRVPYGHGNGDGAGHCAVGEMWAYFLAATLNKDRYGGSLPSFPSWMWFRPEILSCMYERGISRAQIFRALKKTVTTVDALHQELVTQYPEKQDLIDDAFSRYGK